MCGRSSPDKFANLSGLRIEDSPSSSEDIGRRWCVELSLRPRATFFFLLLVRESCCADASRRDFCTLNRLTNKTRVKCYRVIAGDERVE